MIDETAPTIECPDDIVMNIIGNQCDTMVSIDLPIVLDNCSSVSITNNINMTESASGTFSNGITPVEYIATDVAGNTNTCQLNVSVNGSLGVSSQIVDVTCNGGNDGEIILEILTGNEPFTFNWSNGQVTQNLSNCLLYTSPSPRDRG